MVEFDYGNAQHVEGFSELVSAPGISPFQGRGLGPDFRGQVSSGATREWWRGKDPGEPDLVWLTAPVLAAADTVFVFIGESANLLEGLYPPNQATLSVNDRKAITFDLGQRIRRVWTEGDFHLEFIPRQIHSSVDGYHRQFETGGCCGEYRLGVPASGLATGEPVLLKVVLEPLRLDVITWFAVRQRTDVLQATSQSNTDEIRQLQSELIHLKRVVGGLTRTVHARLLPERLETEEILIYTHNTRHAHPPDVWCLQNGEVLVAFRDASEHLSNDGRSVLVRSTDGGKTWSDAVSVHEHEFTDYRDPSLTQLQDGTLLMNDFCNALYDGSGRYLGRELTASDVPYRGQPGGTYVGRSSDNGYTWTWPDQPVRPDPHPLFFTGV